MLQAGEFKFQLQNFILATTHCGLYYRPRIVPLKRIQSLRKLLDPRRRDSARPQSHKKRAKENHPPLPLTYPHSDILKNVRMSYNGYMQNTKSKTAKQLERHFKGVANHRRIAILLLVLKDPEITLEAISENLDCNFKTISEHTRRLVQAGLLNKEYKGRKVEHKISPYGKRIALFISKF